MLRFSSLLLSSLLMLFVVGCSSTVELTPEEQTQAEETTVADEEEVKNERAL